MPKCLNCGKEFELAKSNAVYCSNRCGQQYRDRRSRKKRLSEASGIRRDIKWSLSGDPFQEMKDINGIPFLHATMNPLG